MPEVVLEKLAKRLTPAEKRYFEWRQLPQAEGAPPCPFSSSYARQLQHRIMVKARSILYGE